MRRLLLFVSVFLLTVQAYAIELQPAKQDKAFQFQFNGSWLPDVPPIHVGVNNHVQQNNLRSTRTGLETVSGYSKITNNPPAGTLTPVSGFFFKNDEVSEVISKIYNGTYYLLYNHTIAPPGTGDYSSIISSDTYYATFTLGSGPGMFANASKGIMAYADSTIGALIYGSTGVLPNVVFTSNDATLPIADYNDHTDNCNNPAETFTFNNATQTYLYIGSPWLVTDFVVDILTPNGTTSTLALTIFDGSSWSSKAITDGTSSGGVALAQDGTIELAYTSLYPAVTVINGHQLYWYRFALSAGSSVINTIKCRVPVQRPTDVWNGSPRTCIGFHLLRDSEYEDYTSHVYERSTAADPFAAPVGGISGTERIDLMFEEPLQGFNINMLGKLTNKKSATISNIYYWNGSAFATTSGVIDGTLDSGSAKTLNQSGAITWSASSLAAKPHEAFGVFGYHYVIYFSAAITDAQDSITSSAVTFTAATSTITLGSGSFENYKVGQEIHITGSTSNDSTQTISQVNDASIVVYGTLVNESAGASVTIYGYDVVDHDGTSIDTVTGIAAPLNLSGYDGVGYYSGRTMLIDGNRVDYSLPDYPWVFNGVNTSNMGNKATNAPLNFGDSSDIVAVKELSNRYGSNIYKQWVVIKSNKTYTLSGSQPYLDFNEPFVVKEMSDQYGIISPMTLTEVVASIEPGSPVKRNALIWLDASGPVLFDGAVVVPITGIENYFDPAKTEYIKTSIATLATSYFDSVTREWNLIFPSGSSATANNTWLVLQTDTMKWYRKVPAAYPEYAVGVEDAYGFKYNYGQIPSAHLMRLDNTYAWDGTAITWNVRTGIFSPPMLDEVGMWSYSQFHNLKVMAEETSEDSDITATIYAKRPTGTEAITIPLNSTHGDVAENELSDTSAGIMGRTYQVDFAGSNSTSKVSLDFWGYKASMVGEE
jgi:hypothetical protein